VAPEAVAQQVQGVGVGAGGGEAEHAGQQAQHQVGQGQVRVLVVEGPVQVQHLVGEPAHGEQAHEHQHDLSQPLPGVHLEERGGVSWRGESAGREEGSAGRGGVNWKGRSQLEEVCMCVCMSVCVSVCVCMCRGGQWINVQYSLCHFRLFYCITENEVKLFNRK